MIGVISWIELSIACVPLSIVVRIIVTASTAHAPVRVSSVPLSRVLKSQHPLHGHQATLQLPGHRSPLQLLLLTRVVHVDRALIDVYLDHRGFFGRQLADLVLVVAQKVTALRQMPGGFLVV